LIAPLRKRTKDGAVYTRDEKVEALLSGLETLPRDSLLARCRLQRRNQAGYVPSECLLYFVRANRTSEPDAHFSELYKILVERILRALPEPESADGESLSLTNLRIRERVLDRFVERLAKDRREYEEKLDYFEVRFDGALANLRRDAQDSAWREENRTAPLTADEETGELAAEVETALGSFNPFDETVFEAADYRRRLDAAIDRLPSLQRRIMEMIRQGFPIDSNDGSVTTIAGTLGRAEKTIRLQRDKAYVALHAELTSGEQQ